MDGTHNDLILHMCKVPCGQVQPIIPQSLFMEHGVQGALKGDHPVPQVSASLGAFERVLPNAHRFQPLLPTSNLRLQWHCSVSDPYTRTSAASFCIKLSGLCVLGVSCLVLSLKSFFSYLCVFLPYLKLCSLANINISSFKNMTTYKTPIWGQVGGCNKTSF